MVVSTSLSLQVATGLHPRFCSSFPEPPRCEAFLQSLSSESHFCQLPPSAPELISTATSVLLIINKHCAFLKQFTKMCVFDGEADKGNEHEVLQLLRRHDPYTNITAIQLPCDLKDQRFKGVALDFVYNTTINNISLEILKRFDHILQ